MYTVSLFWHSQFRSAGFFMMESDWVVPKLPLGFVFASVALPADGIVLNRRTDLGEIESLNSRDHSPSYPSLLCFYC